MSGWRCILQCAEHLCSLASVWKYPHHLIIKGHLSILSSLHLGTMPDTCHFCYAQELLLPSTCLGAQSWNTARISFFMEAADQGGQNGIHMSHFRVGPQDGVWENNTGGLHQAAAYDQGDTFPPTLSFPRGGKNSRSLRF